MTAAIEGGEWSAGHPGRTLPQGKTRYPFYRRLGEPQGRSGRAEDLVLTGIRSRTFQPVAQSLYRLSYPAPTYIQKDPIFTDESGFVGIFFFLFNYSVETLILTRQYVEHEILLQTPRPSSTKPYKAIKLILIFSIMKCYINTCQ